jgi:hypothetical protein
MPFGPEFRVTERKKRAVGKSPLFSDIRYPSGASPEAVDLGLERLANRLDEADTRIVTRVWTSNIGVAQFGLSDHDPLFLGRGSLRERRQPLLGPEGAGSSSGAGPAVASPPPD